jgi:hypothetical protein
MTVDAARRTRRRASAKSAGPEPTIAPPAPIAIGEIDQTIFECPSCARPLALGARGCPGCGTRLLNGVALGKASGFMAAGLAAGLLLGAGGGLLFGARQAAVLAPAAAASAAPLTGSNGAGRGTTAPGPTATATTGPTGTGSTGSAGIPPSIRTALVQVVGTNDRLATAEAGLRAALSAPAFDSSAVAQILRSVSADSVFRQQLADRIAAWPGSSAVGAELVTFYGSIHDTAANGLLASVQNRAAYRAAATAMIKLLDRLPAVDSAVRAAALSAGVNLAEASGAPTAP